ncbi:MAG: AAA family ATPase [Bacteroidia bacterium]
MNKRSLIVLRGLPGSGKSSLAELLSENGKYPVYSIDSFFTDPISGEYHFDFSRNHLAYKKCEEDVKNAMSLSLEKIFVDNTFTIEWELEPYFKLAAQFKYRLFVLTVENRHGNKNIHNISEEQLKKMADKYKVQLIPA